MKKEIEQARQILAQLGRKMMVSGLVAGTWGNISCRIEGEDLMVITPSGMDYANMQPSDMVLLDLAGQVIDGIRKPSSETPLHLAIYRNRKDVAGIVHTHSEVATAFSVLREPIEPVVEDAAMLVGGSVQVAGYALPGTAELAQHVVAALEDRYAVLMANHGLVGVGRRVEEAFTVCQVVEKCARVYAWAKALGKPVLLPEQDVSMLCRMYRSSYGQPKKLITPL